VITASCSLPGMDGKMTLSWLVLLRQCVARTPPSGRGTYSSVSARHVHFVCVSPYAGSGLAIGRCFVHGSVPTMKKLKFDISIPKYLRVTYRYFHGPSHRYSDWLRDGRPRGRISSPGRVKNLLFSTLFTPALRFTQPPIQWIPGALPRG
jgi:hypothetical protein